MEWIILVFIFISFLVSASCGLGGSLILIPSLSLFFGIKESIILSSLLLGTNNLVKVYFFRQHIKILPIAGLLLAITIGSAIGAMALLKLDEEIIAPIFILHVIFSFVFQRYQNIAVRKKVSLAIAFVAGLFSGTAGTAGPLKGIALKCNVLSKAELVAGASLLSFLSDITKSSIFLLPADGSMKIPWTLFFASVAIMPLATALGKHLNQQMSQKAYEALFYSVMSGYIMRLLV